MDTPAFTRTRYDINTYEYDLGESVQPLNYTTDVGRFENDKRCTAFNPNVNNYTSTSDIENDPWKMGRRARVVDEESELFLLNYPLTRDPYGKYLPKAGPKLSNWTDCEPITDKLTDKLNPEKLLLSFLTKNISGLGNIMTASNIANTATNSEMSTSEKLLEIAKILNPTVRLVTKLYDTYQAISGDGFNEKSNKEIPNITEINNTKEISKLTEINNTRIEQHGQTSDQELITKLLNATNNIKKCCYFINNKLNSQFRSPASKVIINYIIN
jgi:hypothetical protein